MCPGKSWQVPGSPSPTSLPQPGPIYSYLSLSVAWAGAEPHVLQNKIHNGKGSRPCTQHQPPVHSVTHVCPLRSQVVAGYLVPIAHVIPSFHSMCSEGLHSPAVGPGGHRLSDLKLCMLPTIQEFIRGPGKSTRFQIQTPLGNWCVALANIPPGHLFIHLQNGENNKYPTRLF